MKNLFILSALALSLVSCGGNATSSKGNADSTKTSVAQVVTITIDSLLNSAEANVGKEMVVEGVCTHACRHGATKIFLMGSDHSKVIRVQAGDLGSFDTKAVNSKVKVVGTLEEQRIDEAYLQNWESQLKEHAEEQHGDGEAGCSTEKSARGEKGNTTETRIADFRKRIAERKAESGKDYLSFYFVTAKSYEIL